MKLRLAAGVSLIVATSLLSGLKLNDPMDRVLERLTGIREITPSDQTLYIDRVKQMKTVLPQRGVVGYGEDTGNVIERYLLTQLALAPLLVDRASEHLFVVGSFEDPTYAQKIAPRVGLRIVKDFGGGLVVLTRAPQR
jgi:hypothetical protein